MSGATWRPDGAVDDQPFIHHHGGRDTPSSSTRNQPTRTKEITMLQTLPHTPIPFLGDGPKFIVDAMRNTAAAQYIADEIGDTDRDRYIVNLPTLMWVEVAKRVAEYAMAQREHPERVEVFDLACYINDHAQNALTEVSR
jgi:hypothetical protein